jgi:hypothetical protein
MRRAEKRVNSLILTLNLQYIPGNYANNKKIADILQDEQNKFCAYTDEYISRTGSGDIEHFNPTLKGTAQDGYHNWFLVKHQWNLEKSYKWEMYQPSLHPTAEDFEERIVYIDGDYIVKSDEDDEAKNTLQLLKLDDPALADERKRYIKRKRKEIEISGEETFAYFTTLISDNICQVSYLRAIKEEFGVDLWTILS